MIPEQLALIKENIKKMRLGILKREGLTVAQRKEMLKVFNIGIDIGKAIQEHEDMQYFIKKVDSIVDAFEPLEQMESPKIKHIREKVIPKLEKIDPRRKALTNDVSVKDLTIKKQKVSKI